MGRAGRSHLSRKCRRNLIDCAVDVMRRAHCCRMLGLEVNVISAVSGGAMTAAYYVGSRDAQFSVSVQPSHLLLRR